MNNFKNILVLDSSMSNHLVLVLQKSQEQFCSTLPNTNLETDLINQIDHIIKKADINLNEIDAFVLGAGPGSFLGLRLGFCAIRTLAWLYDTPITLVSSLELLRRSFSTTISPNQMVVSCIDAKMQRLFARIEINNQVLLNDCDIFPQELESHINNFYQSYNISEIHILGSGCNIIQATLASLPINCHSDIVITCNSINHQFLNHIPPANFSKYSIDQLVPIDPNYLRPSAAEMSLNK
ncbi:MAG: tRNA (adenosine(37)-N6)-threonylcarbamoyltransferase complex dimerization subunit type 1 TsaB [Brevinemataceae bacterium]